ncbi:MAG: anaerobic sulfite reductase subunit AsrB [Cetobacterium sp.]|uniref:Anaerobic sulfite reductase subunit B n=1 Tax=Cetobacterium ceti TaxID=180163 RepID=A0A1T4KHD4_9FUSO|nr:anaerobic sulfite reductase subunit AsrB [Cetobacterium ceti]MCJ8343297.1 anaerobic sulfite reductase subunit AsrB [Cetobacterium sp.]SJZ41830.1 anaerobic sulfite reductase subunit B [Cetobacterium ceti]
MENVIMPQFHKLLKVTKMTDIEYLFRVEYNSENEVEFGQFMQISLPQVGECPISITDFSKEEGWMEFLIRKVGVVTDKIFELKAGDILPMRGPYGKGFNIDNYRGKNLIVVAGGSGLAPVRSLINYINKYPESVESLELLFGFKDSNSILFKDEIVNWRNKFPMILTVDKGCGIDGECVGLVTEYVPQLNIKKEDFSNYEVVIVGPPNMMKYTAMEFEKLGISSENIWISFERKMSCAVGKCGHCRVDETYVCLEGPVFKYTDGKYLVD